MTRRADGRPRARGAIPRGSRGLRACLVACALVACARVAAAGEVCLEPAEASSAPGDAAPPLPAEPFRPSSVTTRDGAPIPLADFIPAARCGGCHVATHAAWAQSLHRNAGREPFYKHSV